MWLSWIFGVVGVLTVAGNVCTLLIFTRTPHLRVRKHVLIVNLAVADLLVGLILIPMFIYVLEGIIIDWKRNILFTVYTMLDVLFGTASICGLAALAIERAYATYRPFKHRTLSKSSYIIGIIVIWILASISATCFYPKIFLLLPSRYLFLVLISPLLISLVLIIVSYTLIWMKIICVTPLAHVIIAHQRDKKLTVTLLITTCVSLIAWIPFQVINICGPYCFRQWGLSVLSLYAFKVLHYGNSLVNPIIYALRMREFKTAIMRTLRCRGNPPILPFNLRGNSRPNSSYQETRL